MKCHNVESPNAEGGGAGLLEINQEPYVLS